MMLIEIFTASKCICSVVKPSGEFLLFWKKVTGIFLFFPLFPSVVQQRWGSGRDGTPVLLTAFLLAAACAASLVAPDGFALPLPCIFYYQNCLDLTQLAGGQRRSGLLL